MKTVDGKVVKSALSKAQRSKKAEKKAAKVKKSVAYVIDCTRPVEEEIFDAALLEAFLNDKIKINNKTGKLGGVVTITREKTKVSVAASIPISKRYLKYLVKKFLKKNKYRDYLKVVSSDKNTYQIKPYNIEEDAE